MDISGKAADEYFSKVQLQWYLGLALGSLAGLGQGALGLAEPSLEHYLSEQLQGLRRHIISYVAAFLSCTSE